MKNIQRKGKFKTLTKGHPLWWYGGGNEAWPSIEAAKLAIPEEIRPGKTIGVFFGTEIIEYWWNNDDLSDNGLILKQPSAPAFAVSLDPGIPFGKYVNGDIVPAFNTIQEQLRDIAQKILEPILINPSFSLSLASPSIRIIGSSENVHLTYNFNRGQINGDLVGIIWDSGAFQNFRAGDPINFTINGITQGSNVLVIPNVVALLGLNTYSGSVAYGIGPEPLNSANPRAASDSPFPASDGSDNIRSASFEGVYPIFASTSNITTATQQNTISMLSSNYIIYTLVAESGGNKQFFDIPDAWLANRALTSIQFFNTVSGSFDTTNQISTFATSAISKNIVGNVVNYTRYINKTSDRGAIQIRLIF